jgi:hypothetical protein
VTDDYFGDDVYEDDADDDDDDKEVVWKLAHAVSRCHLLAGEFTDSWAANKDRSVTILVVPFNLLAPEFFNFFSTPCM